MKQKPKNKTVKNPIRLSKSDNQLLSIIMNEGKCKTRTEAVRMGLILAAQQYGNINSIIMPASLKRITKIKKEYNMSTNYGTLINYTTKEEISPANRTQLAHALNAKPLGIILVDGIRCVVVPPPAGSQGLLEACTDYGDHEDDYGTGVDA